MIIFTVAETTSSFVGMTKGFAAAPKTFISDRCAAIRSRGPLPLCFKLSFFFRPNSSTYHFAFQKFRSGSAQHHVARYEKVFGSSMNYRTNATLV